MPVAPLNSAPITTATFAALSTIGILRPPPYSGSPTGYFNNNPAFAGAPPNFSTLYSIASTIVTNPSFSTLSNGYTTPNGSSVPFTANQ